MSTRTVHIPGELVDRLIELYCDWRTGCAEVKATYERFLGASSSDRGAAFAAYTAALDREQAACESYAEQVLLIQARCQRQAETPIAIEGMSRLRRLIDRLTSVWTQLDYAERRRFEITTGIPVLPAANDRRTRPPQSSTPWRIAARVADGELDQSAPHGLVHAWERGLVLLTGPVATYL